MEAFSPLNAVAVPLAQPNVDTDQLVPARFLHCDPSEVGPVLFNDLRLTPEGEPRPDFILNKPVYAGAEILVALENFGCGSSREHAVWGLLQYGFRSVIAPSFGDIFYNNSFKNGLLPVVLPKPRVETLLAQLRAEPGLRVKVNLLTQTVAAEAFAARFEIDPFFKESLLTGRDELAMTLTYRKDIETFERDHVG
jgi:3-isopropylmalate/(R)-2-methylmalate dehydratase small subunit